VGGIDGSRVLREDPDEQKTVRGEVMGKKRRFLSHRRQDSFHGGGKKKGILRGLTLVGHTSEPKAGSTGKRRRQTIVPETKT